MYITASWCINDGKPENRDERRSFIKEIQKTNRITKTSTKRKVGK